MSEQWRNRRVLVTGAGGFIGSHLSENLMELGSQLRAFVHYNALGTAGWLDANRHPAIEIVAGDICDRDCVRQAMQGVDTVFHLAALIGIPYSYRAPESYLRTNVQGTLNVLQCAREMEVRRLVHTSTSEVYGSAQRVPIAEDHPLVAQSPYSASKIAADKQAESYFHSFGLPVVIVRPFNTFGPRQSLRAVIPTIINQCLRKQAVKLGNLHPTRDFNYIDDTVAGFIKAAGAGEEAVGRTFNLGSGREISIGDLAELVAQQVGTPALVESEEQRVRPPSSEVDRLLADASLAKSLLGWQPKISLEEGLGRTVAWLRENLDRYPAGSYGL